LNPGGYVRTDFTSNFTDDSCGLVEQPDGKLVVAGGTNGNFAVARYAGGVGTERHYATSDVQGSVTALVNPAGQVVERQVLDPYGKAKSYTANFQPKWSSSFGWNIAHQGGRVDAGTNLIHFRHRWLHTTLGRWTQRDPAGYVDGPMLVQYAKSNPSTKSDATGLATSETAKVFFDDRINQGYGNPWTRWYFNTDGSGIDLEDVGLLGAFRSHPSVRAQVGSFRDYIASEAAEKWAYELACGEGATWKDSDVLFTDVTNGADDETVQSKLLWEVGRSAFFASAEVEVQVRGCRCCDGEMWPEEYRFFGTLTFAINDRFADPLDIGAEIPTGKPFPITASWTEEISGQGKIISPCDVQQP
jgi:RHS repeat-associated protein